MKSTFISGRSKAFQTSPGYTVGDEILHLKADDFGQWVGQLHWRGVSGMDRQDPLRFVATTDKLDASDGPVLPRHAAGAVGERLCSRRRLGSGSWWNVGGLFGPARRIRT